MSRKVVTIDANEAAAYVAYRVNEVIAIYPITPSSPMGEWADEWAAQGVKNLWGTVPSIQEMQSEGGAAGAAHGALQTGSLTTTFTASQGLLLMIPNMFKIAGELTSAVFHIAARTLATHALSIFGDHSDVMSARSTGFAMLCSGSVQEVMDFALISQAATLASRIPFMHFFDGFRTSHEVSKIEQLDDSVIRAMIDEDRVLEHRLRGLSPDRPVLRGTAQNPDVFFQAREAINRFYEACPGIVQREMDRFAKLTGRTYRLFDYVGAPDAERVIVVMGSGAEVAHETAEFLAAKGEKVGVLKVRLYRPFSMEAFVQALPKTVKALAVLDRTKEPGAVGEPMYQDVINALVETGRSIPRVVGGRYGLSSKDFTPAMVKAVFDELGKPQPRNHFTVGINDDVTHTSLAYDAAFSTEPASVIRALFYGLGSDGTVGANKNSIKIIGEDTNNYAQGYFVYDSKKSGSITVSHLRFGPKPIRSSYLVSKASFVACHQSFILDKLDVLEPLVEGGVFLINFPGATDQVWDKLPRSVQEGILRKKARFFVIDAYKVAKETGMKTMINTIMQTCFFAISGVLPKDEAIEAIKYSIKKAYGKKGEEIVKMNFNAVDQTLANLHEVKVPAQATSKVPMRAAVVGKTSEFVRTVTARIIEGKGDDLPVSAMPVDGTFPTATSQFEKRNISMEVPVWDKDICIQCGKCAMVCPHAVVRLKLFDPALLKNAPEGFRSAPAKAKDWAGLQVAVQTSPEDCTGCGVCLDVCPAKNKTNPQLKALNLQALEPVRAQENRNWEFFLSLPEFDRTKLKLSLVRDSQVLEPLFEFSGACAGCGETPYVKLLSQLFGDRAVIANATGCTSIYGGNLPTTPWAKNGDGRGPAWCNSLFEDNAEFGLGFRLSLDKQNEMARELLQALAPQVGETLVKELLQDPLQKDEASLRDQRARVAALKTKLAGIQIPQARQLEAVADTLARKSVWILGGDGWAYDIGYGGLDHVIASGRNVNILVLDTEVYSNTGGQMSKATPRGAVAKFAAGGKQNPKKDLGLIAMSYGNVYVASVSLGARDDQTLKAFIEADQYDGPSIIIAYSHCIAHGIKMPQGLQEQKNAVASGYWPLYRFNPALAAEGKNPFQLDSAAPKISFEEYAYRQNRFKMLTKSKPEDAKRLVALAQKDVTSRRTNYEWMFARPGQEAADPGATAGA